MSMLKKPQEIEKPVVKCKACGQRPATRGEYCLPCHRQLFPEQHFGENVETRSKKQKLDNSTRDTLVEAKSWIEKVSHYPIFQNWKTRNTPNPTWKPDGRIGQELAEKLKKILAETS